MVAVGLLWLPKRHPRPQNIDMINIPDRSYGCPPAGTRPPVPAKESHAV
jgi:hypothetical protein